MKSRLPAGDLALMLLLVSLVLATILATGPFADVPRNDDFSYAHSARVFAETGRIVYNGWSSPMLWPQLALGALVVKVFGFSYHALDLTGIILALLSTVAMYGLARACGCLPHRAALATAVLTLNPIFLAIAPSFMTDVPSLLLLLVSLLVLIKSLETDADGEIRIQGKTFAISVVLGIIAGSNRQISWVAYLGALATIIVLLPRQRRFTIPAALGFFGCAALLTSWLNHRPDIVPVDLNLGLATLLQDPLTGLLITYKILNMLGLFLLPLAILALGAGEWRNIRFASLLLACLFLGLLPAGTSLHLTSADYRLKFTGQYFTSSGVVVGGVHPWNVRPTVLPPAVVRTLALLGVIGMAGAGYLLVAWFGGMWQARGRKVTRPQLAVSAMAVTSATQVIAMLPWFGMSFIYDRYLLLLLPGLLIFLAAHPPGKTPLRAMLGATGLLMTGLWIIGFGFASEYMGYTRARAALFKGLTDRGIARREIDGGLELDAETQLQTCGSINNPLRKKIPGAFRPDAEARFVPEKYAVLFPALDVRYLLSTETNPDPAVVWPDPLASVTYTSLFPPHEHSMYIYRVNRFEK